MSDSSINIVKKIIKNFWDEERDTEIRAFADAPLFRPMEFVINSAIPEILATIGFCTFIYVVSFSFADRIIPKAELEGKDPQTILLKRRRICYQMVHFFTNLVLGCAGLYYNSRLNPDPTPQELVQKMEGHSFGTFQVGYQLWAIFVGFLVREDPLMLGHHTAVILAASTMVFFTNGMRYWCPFLMGLVEVTSVPLVIVNIFKEHKELVKQYPRFHHIVRTGFAFLFLYVRVWMFVPRNVMQMYDHVTTWSAAPSDQILYKMYSGIVFISALFLTFLQLMWGVMVVQGFIKVYSKIFVGSKEKIKAN